MGDDDILLRERPGVLARGQSPSQLLRDLNKSTPPVPEPASASAPTAEPDPDALPLPGDDYAARSRISNKPEAMLSLFLKDWSVVTFAYGDLRHMAIEPAREPGKSPVYLLRFIGVADVRLEGRHLIRLGELLRRQRLGWLAELPARRDCPDEDAVVITGISIKLVE